MSLKADEFSSKRNNIKASIIEDITQSNEEYEVGNRLPPKRPVYVPKDYSNIGNIQQMIRQKINNVYRNFIMTKVEQYNEYGIYKALIDALTTGDSKYIVVVVPNDQSPIGSERLLSSLNWICFQTRTTDNIGQEFNNIQVYPQSYYINSSNNISDPVNLVDEKRTHFLYRPENLPLKIEVLKLNSSDSFASRGTVTSALELHQTILTIEN